MAFAVGLQAHPSAQDLCSIDMWSCPIADLTSLKPCSPTTLALLCMAPKSAHGEPVHGPLLHHRAFTSLPSSQITPSHFLGTLRGEFQILLSGSFIGSVRS